MVKQKKNSNHIYHFNSLILIWFDKNKRNLPWRAQSDPYKIWLSEIILQQTRVAQGTDYYLKFTQQFPSIQDLATASEQEVLRLWQGLGYYSRARNLHFTAKWIAQEFHGVFPSTFKDLIKLKGVGDYTAAAIASIAFHEAVPAIDGNAFRVFARYFNIDLDISIPKNKKYFFELGKEIIDPDRPGDFNQAVMELGATICLPKNPKCEICPVNESCEGLARKTVDQLPVKSKKVKVTHRFFHFLEITDGKNYLMVKREKKDVWLNLFTFPMIETSDTELLISDAELSEIPFQKTHEMRHLLTHQRLHIVFWRAKINQKQFISLSNSLKTEIYRAEDLNELPLPKPMEKYLDLKI